ncbi:MAG: toprim domain-containing protein [Ignavibacteria bacterium]|nr:toprim domain-containing protein [Ignavibacteria bacterium]
MNQIEEIKNRLPILDLLYKLGITPNKSGFIPSIYKKDITPSLKIYPKSNSYFCFATNKGGDVISFYSDFYKIDMKQTVKELSSICGISSLHFSEREKLEIVSEDHTRNPFEMLSNEKEIFEERKNIIATETGLSEKDSGLLAFRELLENRKTIQSNIFTAFYNYSISNGYEEQAYTYLISSKRGLTERSLKQFKIFTIHSGNKSISFLKDSFTKDEISISGLFSKNYFLFSKHRIVIPYIENGRIVYLRGRYFFEGKTTPENSGKYIGCNNWSLTLSPKRFFNFDLLQTLKPFEPLLICEGEFDAITAVQNNINTIAIAGVSNFPKDQIKLLKYFNIFLSFDNDIAGEKATKEISSLFEQPVKVIKLKYHKDLTELFSNEHR